MQEVKEDDYIICRICKEPFLPKPAKNRRRNECPSCKPEPHELSVPVPRPRKRPLKKPLQQQSHYKKQLRMFLRGMKQFKGISPKEAFSRWEKAYLEGQAWAKKLFEIALSTIQREDSDGF